MPALLERQQVLPGLDVEPLLIDTTDAREAIAGGLGVAWCRMEDARRAGGLAPWQRLAVDVAEAMAEGIARDVPGYLRQRDALLLGRRVLGLLAFTAWLEVPR